MKRFSACTYRAKRQKETTFVERKQKRLRTSFFVFLTSSLASAKSSTVVLVQLAVVQKNALASMCCANVLLRERFQRLKSGSSKIKEKNLVCWEER